MAEKNYDYYLKKTKTDTAKRKQADLSKNARAESAAAAVFFLPMAWRRGLWMVTVAMLVLAIFAFFVPFYTKNLVVAQTACKPFYRAQTTIITTFMARS